MVLVIKKFLDLFHDDIIDSEMLVCNENYTINYTATNQYYPITYTDQDVAVVFAPDAVQDVLDLIVLDKGLVGIGGHHKAGRNREAQNAGKLTQIGKLTASRGYALFSQFVQG